MTRNEMINVVGNQFHTANIEGGEFSYVKEAGSIERLHQCLGYDFQHYKLDIRFKSDDVVVLIETKQSFVKADELQLAEYVNEEKVLHPTNKIIAILANTSNDVIKVWKNEVNDQNLLHSETVLDSMGHYEKIFNTPYQNDRETVLKNTYNLNEMLHKYDIPEALRSQFVGTTLIFIKDIMEKGKTAIDDELINSLKDNWKLIGSDGIIGAIKGALDRKLDDSENKEKKIELLRKNVLESQKVKNLTVENWTEILEKIMVGIYRYINTDSSEGQDILNMFFIAFNKYTGRADKNQAFTPDHITDFMCRVVDVDKTKVIFDGTCGSGSFLVQAMVKEFADCRRNTTEEEAKKLIKKVKDGHIFGIEYEEKAFGLSTTNMLIHGDGNSNILLGDLFKSEEFIKKANPDIVLMNPPYNAKPKDIPDKYKKSWSSKQLDGKEDATKGFCFVQFIADVIKDMNEQNEECHKPRKEVKMAVLLPVSAAIGNNMVLKQCKTEMLKNNHLDAVFSLPAEIFYPGASVSACCMVFTLGRPHVNADGTVDKTFFGYYREDGFKKKKNLGRIEQFDSNGKSIWKEIENQWLSLYKNKEVVDGMSAMAIVDGNSEWLCEAYMNTDYSKLTAADFQSVVNNYLAYLVKEGILYGA